jgi:two-component system chemotaxis response regulator CheB
MRRTLRQIIEQDPELELLDMARDGLDGLAKARELRPDVISMDINMPQMDGITALQHIMAENICPVVMVSSLTQKGAVTTFEALELGAFDFVGKPDGTVSADMSSVARELVSKLKLAARTGSMKRLAGSTQRRKERRSAVPAASPRPPRTLSNAFGYKAVALGISTGGPSTLMEVLPLLPKDLPAAVFLVQHMPASFITSFAARLQKNCALRIVEAQGGMTVEPATCYVAQGDRQLILMQKLSGEVIIRTPSSPQTLFMPSVGIMMESVLGVYGRHTIGVLMTGIGDDGADAMVKVKTAGGHTIAESEETAVVFGMPREAAERGGASVVLPSYAIAHEIIKAI